MKNLIFIAFALLTMIGSFSTDLRAQTCPGCVPTPAGCTGLFGAVCPGTLPAANAGTYYEQDVTLFMPDTINITLPFPVPGLPSNLNVRVSNVAVAISGLADGLTATCSTPNCNFNPAISQYNCFRVCGTPCGGSGDYPIQVTYNYTVSLPLPIPIPAIPFSYTVEMRLNSSVDRLEISTPTRYLCPASTITLTATPNFTTYNWNTSETTQSIVVSNTGVYRVTGIDALGCLQVDSIEIESLSANAGLDRSICPNQIVVLSGAGGDNFSWQPANVVVNPTRARTGAFNVSNTTTFSLTVSNGVCTDTDDVVITVSPTSNCEGSCGQPVLASSNCPNSAVPIVCTTPAAVTGGVAYQQDVTFFIPSTINFSSVLPIPIPIPIPGLPTSVTLDEVFIVDVEGLPDGLDWECDQLGTNCQYFPSLATPNSQYGAIRICGESCDAAGSYDVDVIMQVDLRLPANIVAQLNGLIPGGFDGTAPVPISFTMNVGYTNPLTVSPAGPVSINFGDSVTLTANTTGFTNIRWSNGSTSPSITVSSTGTYSVTAFDGTCDQTVAVSVDVVGSSREPLWASSLKMYPNPAQKQLNVEWFMKNSASVDITLRDIQGKAIQSWSYPAASGLQSHQLLLPTLSGGLYLLELKSGEGTFLRKLAIF